MRKILILISLFLAFGCSTFSIQAVEEKVATSSFELFWPLSSGKTVDESFYFLKTLKENVREMLIFSPAPKADYQVMLGTKRVLEVEKLVDSKKGGPTLKTISLANDQFSKALGNWEKANQSGKADPALRINIKNRLDNLEAFLPGLSDKTEGEQKEKLNNLKQLINQFLQKL